MKRKAWSVAAGGVMGALVLTGLRLGPPHAAPPTAVVGEGTFRQTLVERGTINAARLNLYGSTIAGAQAKILTLVPEGAAVTSGDVLVRFDPAPFQQIVDRESTALSLAQAELLRAREDLRLEQMRAGVDVEAAQAAAGAAEAASANERDGKGPLAIAEAEAAANEARRELQLARTSSEDMHALLAKGFVTRAETDRADQTLRQAADRLRLADLRLKTKREFEQPAALDRSRVELAAAQRGVETAAEAAAARLAQRRATLAFAEGRVREASLSLARAGDQVGRTVVRSNNAGLVVYRELFFGADKRKPQPGDEVWPNQPLVAVPDPGELVAETRVRETDLHKISRDRAVRVFIDAYPDVELPAAVGVIGALAQEDAARAGVRFFPITVRLLEADPRLRTGMTARIEIEVRTIDRATVVPLQALFTDEGVTRCRVLTRGGIEARTVEVLARNETAAAVSAGVRPGDVIVLRDPSR